jgi:hypothetical protein
LTLATVNSNIGSYTKVTINAKGLATAGASATTADIASSTDKRYVTDAQLAALHTFFVESFSEFATGSSGQINTLAHTPKASTAILVSLNGMELKSTQFTVGTGTVQITIPVYQYDVITIAYTY